MAILFKSLTFHKILHVCGSHTLCILFLEISDANFNVKQHWVKLLPSLFNIVTLREYSTLIFDYVNELG